MLSTTKRIITELVSSEESDVWSVLTALRGPDHNESVQVKAATTSVIRYSLGMKVSNTLALSFPDSEEKCAIRKSLETLCYESPYWTTYHFYKHIRDAFFALGLKWDEVNK